MVFALKLDTPGQPPKSVPLTGDKIVLGSLLSNQVVLQDRGVEPIHALIEAHEDGGGERWVITDLGSEGGIKLNGSVVEVEAEIRPSDVVEIGAAKLVIEAVRMPASKGSAAVSAGGMGLKTRRPTSSDRCRHTFACYACGTDSNAGRYASGRAAAE